MNTNVSYIDAADSTTVVISSDDELESLPGYTLSSNNRQLSKTVQSDTISGNPTVCDHYNNCTTLNIQHTNSSYKLAQTVTFSNSTVNKVYGDTDFTNLATTNGDGIITYTSNDTSVAEVNSSTGEVSIKKAGTATITATAASTDSYNEGSASYILTVEKATSVKPSEINNTFDGVTGERLSTIEFTTPGLIWLDGSAIILPGENEYQASYTQNDDTNNYTTEVFNVTVNGVSDTPSGDDTPGDNVPGEDSDSKDQKDEVPVPNTSKTNTPDTGEATKTESNSVSVMLILLLPTILALIIYRHSRKSSIKHRKFDV